MVGIVLIMIIVLEADRQHSVDASHITHVAAALGEDLLRLCIVYNVYLISNDQSWRLLFAIMVHSFLNIHICIVLFQHLHVWRVLVESTVSLKLSPNGVVAHLAASSLVLAWLAADDNVSVWLEVLNAWWQPVHVIFEASEAFKAVDVVQILGNRSWLLNGMILVWLILSHHAVFVLIGHVSLE